MKKIDTVITASAKQTMAFARKFAARLEAGDIIALQGCLGSGKTTFVKGLALGLGVDDAKKVKSPTFVVMHIYPARLPLYHFDLYRMESMQDLFAIGFEDFAGDPGAVSCVEWAEKTEKTLPEKTYVISIRIRKDNRREIKITRKTERKD